MILNESKTLSMGIFWVVAEFDEDSVDWSSWELLFLNIPCDSKGEVAYHPSLNSKKGNSFNHKKSWSILSSSLPKHMRGHSFNYYPRGRVEIANNQATIYLNPHIQDEKVINKIKREFRLQSIKVRVFVDGSTHYHCYLDDESIR